MCFLIADGFTVHSYIATLIYIILVSWTFSSIGVIVGVFAKSWDHIGVFTTFIFMPLTMLGGVFWSVAWLPYPWGLISKFNPVYWMVNGLRYAMLNVVDQNFSFELSLMRLYKSTSILYIIVAFVHEAPATNVKGPPNKASPAPNNPLLFIA